MYNVMYNVIIFRRQDPSKEATQFKHQTQYLTHAKRALYQWATIPTPQAYISNLVTRRQFSRKTQIAKILNLFKKLKFLNISELTKHGSLNK